MREGPSYFVMANTVNTAGFGFVEYEMVVRLSITVVIPTATHRDIGDAEAKRGGRHVISNGQAGTAAAGDIIVAGRAATGHRFERQTVAAGERQGIDVTKTARVLLGIEITVGGRDRHLAGNHAVRAMSSASCNEGICRSTLRLVVMTNDALARPVQISKARRVRSI